MGEIRCGKRRILSVFALHKNSAFEIHTTPKRAIKNGFEVHREIGMTPQEAWEKTIEEGRSKLRSIPRDGWWELVWSEWYLHVDYAKPLVGDLPHCETF